MKTLSLICLLLLLFSFSQIAAGQTLVIGKYTEPPLSDDHDEGMLDLLLKETFTRVGRTLVLSPLPGERSLINANHGVTDGDINRIGGLTRLYPNLVQVHESNMVYEFVIFTRDPELQAKVWEDLAPYRVGVVRGWKILEENIKATSLTRVSTPPLLFGLLRDGRVDAVVYERLQGEYLASKLGLDGLRIVDPPLATREMYIYLNAKHAALTPLLAKALREIKADGTYEAIISRTLKKAGRQ